MNLSEHRLAGLLVIWIFVVVNLSGCATVFDEVSIPEYAGPINVYPSPEHVSILSEIPAGDNLVENSQVFLSRDKKLSPFLTGLGVMVEAHSRVTDVQHGTATLSVKFHTLLSDIISKRGGSPGEPRLQIVNDVEDADIVLLPSVQLDSRNLAHANFRLTIRFIHPETKQKITKDYFVLGYRTRSVTGNDSWSANGAALLNQDARSGFSLLIDIAINDLSGRYEDLSANGEKRIMKWRTSFSGPWSSSIVLDELSDHLLLAPMVNDKVVRNTLFLVWNLDVRVESY